MKFETSSQFAKKMDRLDPLKDFRKKFWLPKNKEQKIIYLTGHSLGLQPRNVRDYIHQELEDWAELGSNGHVKARRPWTKYHHFAKKTLAKLVGAKPSEVIAMNQLTINLHLMMVSFYRPNKQRYKIITEAGAFSSDQYAFETQVKFHGFKPEEAIVEVKPREGEFILRTEDILNTIALHADSLALVIFGGVQYYTGQFFDIKKITEAGHQAGACVGFDMAHAIGNVPLNLHGDEVDFAVWCTYKYLNSGPGAIAGAFVHEKHAASTDLPRFAGWWGHREEERFLMRKGFKPMPGIDGWQLSNIPVIQASVHLAALEIFQQTNISALRKKSKLLTGYLEYLLMEIDPHEQYFQILTPKSHHERGCQLSIYLKNHGNKIYNALAKAGVSADWREPGVIRVAPVPLYNSFQEVFDFAVVFKKAIKTFYKVSLT